MSAEAAIELPGGGQVCFTTAAHGNLSPTVGEGSERATLARERLRERLGLTRLLDVRQVHGSHVRVVRGDDRGGGEDGQRATVQADGQVTGLPGVGLLMLVADCLPVALGARNSVAMLHAGWRGLADGVLEQGVRMLRRLDDDGDIAAVIGPGAGVCCYEAGPEVHAAFGGAHGQGRNLDLRAIARERLEQAGVTQIRELKGCTICDEGMFSFRREGAHAGRQAGVAWLR